MDEGYTAPPDRSSVQPACRSYRHRQLYAADSITRPPRQTPYGQHLRVLGLLAALLPGLVIGEPEGWHPQTAAPNGVPGVPDTLSMQVEAIPPTFMPVAVRVPEWIRLDPPEAPGARGRHVSTAPPLWTGAAVNGPVAPAKGSVAPAKGSVAPAEVALRGTPVRKDLSPHPSAVDEATRVIGVGEASYYGQAFSGNPTASGEPFDPAELTAAHRSLPFGSRVRVTNLRNGKFVVVRINDRGPFVRHRIIDLSRAAAGVIGMIRRGSARVRLQRVE